MKFGGTSVGSAQQIKSVAKLIENANNKTIAVLSAMAGTTNKLVELSRHYYNKNNAEAYAIIDTLEEKYTIEIEELFQSSRWKTLTQQYINSVMAKLRSFANDIFTTYEEKIVLAQGELMSTTMMFNYMNEQKEQKEIFCNVSMLYATDFMFIDKNGYPDTKKISAALNEYLNNNDSQIFITQGFIATNAFGEIDNLKRGGSDYTATLIGAAIGAEEVQIWTDIDGVHNADPRVIDNTHAIEQLSYDEASELAYLGAKILHPTCVKPAKATGVPIRLKNTMQPKASGTLIANQNYNETKSQNLKAIAVNDNVEMISLTATDNTHISTIMNSSLTILNAYGIQCYLTTTAERTFTVCYEKSEHQHDALDDLAKIAAIKQIKDISILSIVGQFGNKTSTFCSKIFTACSQLDILLISFSSTNNSISIVVNKNDIRQAMNNISNSIF